MRVRVSYVATIPDDELIEAGVSLTNKDEIMDFFFDNGGEENFHDYGDGFEILEN